MQATINGIRMNYEVDGAGERAGPSCCIIRWPPT